MPAQTKFPTSDADFDIFVNAVVPYLNENISRLIVTPTGQAALASATLLLTTTVTGWNAVYPLILKVSTTSNTLIIEKNKLRIQIEELLRSVYNDIPLSLVETKDRTALGIVEPSGTHTPAAKPTSIPSITIIKHSHLTIDIRIEDTKTQEPVSKVEDADSIELESAFLPNNVTPAADFPQENDYHHILNSGKSKITISYRTEQIKGTEYLRARYQNTRKEVGPWSEVVTAIII
jgi:hypothetical protein